MDASELGSAAQTTPAAEVAAVRRAQAGDAAAFAALVRLYQRRVVSVAFRLLGNAEDASDVGQDAFVRAFRNLAQLDDPARFGPWLMRVVTNLALNYRRSRAGRAASPLDDTETATADLRNPRTGQALEVALEDDDGAMPEELRAAISRGLEQLPEKQRLALVLFSVEGMPQKEVAEILDCSIELVKWNVFQARRKMRDLLDKFL
ncbi:MAG: sigma-70 family RNA polymerase sigma factor [Planctomycetes bacterium]|nr:sigma-70 family RNA polymerase sigma factor [Planctomycetota bacterium]